MESVDQDDVAQLPSILKILQLMQPHLEAVGAEGQRILCIADSQGVVQVAFNRYRKLVMQRQLGIVERFMPKHLLHKFLRLCFSQYMPGPFQETVLLPPVTVADKGLVGCLCFFEAFLDFALS